MASPALLDLQNLTKQYAGTNAPALDHVSLAVGPGEVYGFLGANGAGKSTTIRTLLNFLEPTSGTATICGLDIVTDAVAAKAHVGYLSGEVELYGKATGQQFLDYMAALQPLKHRDYLTALIERFDVTLKQPIATLSKGNRQKLGIVQAFMHEPEVLILDEPTSGLDPLMQEEFFKLVHESKARGAAVFLSSHNLSETQRMCDRIGIIKHGKLIREQSIGELTDLGAPMFRVVLVKASDTSKLQKAPELTVTSVVNDHTLLVQPKASIAAALAALSKCDIAHFTTEQLALEDEFVKFYEDDKS